MRELHINITIKVLICSLLQFAFPSDSSVVIVQVAKKCPTLCDPIHCSIPGFPDLHSLPEFAQTHVHWVSDATQPSHPLSSPSPALNLSQHQGFFQWVFFASGIGASASVLPMNIQGWFPLGLTGWIFLQSKGLWRVFSSTTTQKHQITVDSDYSHKIERRLLLGRKAMTNMDSVLKAEISLYQQRSV